MRRRELTIPTILGVFLSLIGMGAGLWFLREPIRTAVFASAEEQPSQVKITNITDTSFSVSWITQKATSGYIQYGENNPDLVVSDDRDQASGSVDSYFTHFVTVRGLRPATTYNFRIGSGASKYDQDGQPYQTKTGLNLGSPPAADVAYGQVITANGDPAGGAIVYLTVSGAVPQASLVNATGSWVIPISTARSADLTNYAAYDPQTTQLQIQVVAGSLGSASVTTTTGDDSPVPEITLGQTYNYLSQNQEGQTLNLPTPTPSGDTSELDSKFSDDSLSEATSSSSLVIVSPKFNEKVNATTPEIIGKGPANTQITITVNSTAEITQTISTDSSGNFTFTVPQNLEPGQHTITISALIDGVVKKVQRNFVVLASGESETPAFTSTPSASIKPSPTPSVKPSPTPTALPRVTIPSTSSGVPTSGDASPTIIFALLGSALILSGTFIYKKLAWRRGVNNSYWMQMDPAVDKNQTAVPPSFSAPTSVSSDVPPPPSPNVPPTDPTPATGQPTPPPPAQPDISPPGSITPPPPASAGEPPSKKKWGTGALVGSITAVFLIIASVVTGITLYQRRAEPIATSPKAVDTNPCGSHTVTERTEGNISKAALRGVVTNTCTDQELKFYIQTFWCNTVDTNPGRLGWCNENLDAREYTVPPGQHVEYYEEQPVGNNGECGSAQVDFSYSPSDPPDSLAVGVASYLEPCTGDHTPTPTPVSSFQCQEVKVFRGGVEIQPEDIELGDEIVFRGFASSEHGAVSKLRFTLTKGGVDQTPVEEDAVAAGALFQADYPVTINEATSYTVKAEVVSP